MTHVTDTSDEDSDQNKNLYPPLHGHLLELFGHIKFIQKSHVLTHTSNIELLIQRICYLLSPQAAAAAMVAILLLISSLAVDQLSAAMACS